jgi:hypothetical protein
VDNAAERHCHGFRLMGAAADAQARGFQASDSPQRNAGTRPGVEKQIRRNFARIEICGGKES